MQRCLDAALSRSANGTTAEGTLGESIVVTGATAVDAGQTSTVVLWLGVAFLQTAAL
jgi:hypothetical protein